MGNNKKKRRVRSDVPYAIRLQMEQVAAIRNVRDYSAKIIMLCHACALHELHGKGYASLVRFSLHFKELVDEFYDKDDAGLELARKRLAQHDVVVEPGIPVYVVPGLTPRDQQQFDHGVQAAYFAHLIALITENDVFSHGKEKLEATSVKVEELKVRFRKEGEKFLRDYLEGVGFPIIDGKVTACLDEEDKPVSYKRYLEMQGRAEVRGNSEE